MNAYVGGRSLSDDINTIDDQPVYGFDTVLALKNDWFAIEAGWLHSDESEAGNVVDLDEYFVGARFAPWKLVVEPYVSVGLSVVDGAFEGMMSVPDDTSTAGYIRAGVAYPLTSIFKVGIDGRALLGSDFDTASLEESADYFQLMVFVGVGI